ncbi:MAG: SDR family oxidoreductase [Pseudomonadota bacterium]
MNNILLAGATGYLGSHIARELSRRGISYRALARNQSKLVELELNATEAWRAEVTDAASLDGCCDGIDTVISTVGITRQKDGLRYMDVDYQANLNLLQEAQKSGVRKFIYVSVLHGDQLRHLKICEAKERFVDRLKRSGMDYCVVRPNGFFQDMTEFFSMAKRGRVYLLGNGQWRSNPIDGSDLACACVDAINGAEPEINIGGPEVLTHEGIADLAFAAMGKAPKITKIPAWASALTLAVLRGTTSSRTYGPIEFFLTVMSMDMLAPRHGSRTMAGYFADLQDAANAENAEKGSAS